MLLNLSNHPSYTWPEKQLIMAKANYGSIIDMPFPSIDPELDENGVRLLAEQCAMSIIKALENQTVRAVHLMGEMSFSFVLTFLLQQKDILVICSTTKRIVTEEQNQKKVSHFEFVQFRKYSELFYF